MNYDFTQFIYIRCDKALKDNEDYMKLEYGENTDPDDLQAKAEDYAIGKVLETLSE